MCFFFRDLFQFRLAWDGLLEVGWMKYEPSFGYIIHVRAIICDHEPLEKSVKANDEEEKNNDEEQDDRDPQEIEEAAAMERVHKQYWLYIRYWALQLVRIHHKIGGLDMAYFLQYRPHFLSMLSVFFPTDEYYFRVGAKLEKDLPEYDPFRLAQLIAGSLSVVCASCLPIPIAAELVREVYLILLQKDKESREFLLAAADYCIEGLRLLTQASSGSTSLLSTSSRALLPLTSSGSPPAGVEPFYESLQEVLALPVFAQSNDPSVAHAHAVMGFVYNCVFHDKKRATAEVCIVRI